MSEGNREHRSAKDWLADFEAEPVGLEMHYFRDLIADLASAEKERDDIKAEWNKWVRLNSSWIAEVIVYQKERADAETSLAALRLQMEGLREAWKDIREWVVNLSVSLQKTDIKRDDGKPVWKVIHDSLKEIDRYLLPPKGVRP